MKIFSEDRELLRDLYATKGPLDLYHFHEKYLLSPAQLSRTVRKLEFLGVTRSEGDQLHLTPKGERWILAHRKELFGRLPDVPWRDIPEEMLLRDKKKMNTPYIPKNSELSPEFLDEYGK